MAAGPCRRRSAAGCAGGCGGPRSQACWPRAVTADRGYGQAAVEHDLQALGVHTIAIPRQAKISPRRKTTEHSPGFRKLVKWRTGSEGRISYLKHTYSNSAKRLGAYSPTKPARFRWMASVSRSPAGRTRAQQAAVAASRASACTCRPLAA